MLFNFKRVAKLVHFPTAAEQEQAYLNGAVDRFDLEARERNVDHGAFRNHRLGF